MLLQRVGLSDQVGVAVGLGGVVGTHGGVGLPGVVRDGGELLAIRGTLPLRGLGLPASTAFVSPTSSLALVVCLSWGHAGGTGRLLPTQGDAHHGFPVVSVGGSLAELDGDTPLSSSGMDPIGGTPTVAPRETGSVPTGLSSL